MKNFLLRLVCGSALATSALYAGTGSETRSGDNATTDATAPFPFEADFELAYIGDSEVVRGSRRVRDFDETYSLARFIYTPRVKLGILRLGGSWERFSFGMPSRVQTPDTLQSVSAVIGLDTQFSDSILVRFEAQPGLYGSERLNTDDFMVPFVLGGTYIYSPNVQLVFGVSVDLDRKYPVFPGGGIRWRLAEKWVLNAVVPTPRLEFEANKHLTLYAGANLKGSTFRVSRGFGGQAADNRLNNAVISYTEIRTGAGLEWKLTPETKLSLEGGYLPYREFDFHRADVRYHHESGAPYGAVSLGFAF